MKKSVSNKDESLWKLISISVDYEKLSVAIIHTAIVDVSKFELNDFIISIEFYRGDVNNTTLITMNGPLSLVQVVSYLNNFYIKTIAA